MALSPSVEYDTDSIILYQQTLASPGVFSIMDLEASRSGIKPTRKTIFPISKKPHPKLQDSFLQPNSAWTTPTRPNQTQFINGLRGVAAFAVYLEHFVTPLWPGLLKQYGAESSSNSVLQLPFIRLAYGGSAMVAVFFIISGFVLSTSAIRLSRESNYEQAYLALARSIFQRGFNLYLPSIICTFLVMIACRASLYRDPLLTQLGTRHPILLPSLREQIIDWIDFTNQFMLNPLTFWPMEPSSTYGGHLWTISILFSCSLYLFMTLPVIGQLRPRFAVLVVAALLIIYNLNNGRRPLALTYFGMLLALLSQSPPQTALLLSRKGRVVAQLLASFATLLGMYLCSYPMHGYGRRLGYFDLWIDIDLLTYYSVGAMALTSGLLHQPLFQKPLCWTVPLYLGKICFSLWIVHEPLLQIFGWKTFYSIEHSDFMKEKAEVLRCLILLASWLGYTLITIIIADIFWKCVEMPCKEFTVWLSDKILPTPDQVKKSSRSSQNG
ncbi:acyltransferase family-domain-containing protein [Xylariales sp. PMI_506]|nr:acyltransferase family-domain-containing protein [Xylariales sp. PMI_506]